ncbi:MAG: GGDEF domain-containing protein [Bacteroidetes bacterium]|nr:GGDEF domain-containing protein [Bacteroidota bacterium]
MAWFVGRRVGIFSSLISFTAWFFLDISLVIHFLNPFIIASNSLIIITIFILITILVSSFRISLDHEKKLARTDSLTGAANSRLFSELLQMEVERLERYKHPFTLVYIDTDNLKFVNDNYGHTIGNQVLINIVDFAKNNLRKVDVISRLGGDEFALLLPETSYESSKIVISRFQKGLLSEMRKKNWPITLSIGAVTCNNANITADELLRIADKLMYEIKREGKNSIKQCNSD